MVTRTAASLFSGGALETEVRIPYKQSFQTVQCNPEGKIGWVLLEINWIEKTVYFCNICNRILSLIYGFGINNLDYIES